MSDKVCAFQPAILIPMAVPESVLSMKGKQAVQITRLQCEGKKCMAYDTTLDCCHRLKQVSYFIPKEGLNK